MDSHAKLSKNLIVMGFLSVLMVQMSIIVTKPSTGDSLQWKTHLDRDADPGIRKVIQKLPLCVCQEVCFVIQWMTAAWPHNSLIFCSLSTITMLIFFITTAGVTTASLITWWQLNCLQSVTFNGRQIYTVICQIKLCGTFILVKTQNS